MTVIPSQFGSLPGFDVGVLDTVSHLMSMLDCTIAEERRKAVRGLPEPGPEFHRLEPTPALLEELRAASERLGGVESRGSNRLGRRTVCTLPNHGNGIRSGGMRHSVDAG